MHEWLLLRLSVLGIMVGSGVLYGLAGRALDRWRERRARARSAREAEAVAAEYRVDLTLVTEPRPCAK